MTHLLCLFLTACLHQHPNCSSFIKICLCDCEQPLYNRMFTQTYFHVFQCTFQQKVFGFSTLNICTASTRTSVQSWSMLNLRPFPPPVTFHAQLCICRSACGNTMRLAVQQANCSNTAVFCSRRSSTLPKWIVELRPTLYHTETPQWGVVGRACANVQLEVCGWANTWHASVLVCKTLVSEESKLLT